MTLKRNGGVTVGWLLFLSYVVLVIVAISAWANTKIILEELSRIKKFLGVPEEKSISISNRNYNSSDETDGLRK